MDDSSVSQDKAAIECGIPDERPSDPPWLLLTHHIPPTPAYFRVKVRRRLVRIGAVPLKASVYVLPNGDDALEDFQWLRQEIESEGGEVTICEATFLDRATDERLAAQFREAREADYRDITESAVGLLHTVSDGERDDASLASLRAKTGKIENRLADLVATDFFAAPGQSEARRAVMCLKEAVRSVPWGATEQGTAPGSGRHIGRTWVTRRGIKVDRIASAWLIQRFIDGAARFKFVTARGYDAEEGELRFDMFEGEYTHVGEACTFETLQAEFDLNEPALVALGEIIHDIDCKDDKFGRPEAPGLASLINGITRAHEDDEARLERGIATLDDLYEHFRTPTC